MGHVRLVVISLSLAISACGGAPTKEQTGTVVGGVLGGVVGSQVGGGTGRTAATILGAIAGGVIGGSIGRNMTDTDRLKAADHLLIAAPMWNLSIPYRLKHYIDIVTQPGLTFSFSPARGYSGLLKGKAATLIYASSGDYRPGSGNPRPDHQKPFLEAWLRFVGVTDIDTVAVEPTMGDPAVVARGQTEAEERAKQLAAAFIARVRDAELARAAS